MSLKDHLCKAALERRKEDADFRSHYDKVANIYREQEPTLAWGGGELVFPLSEIFNQHFPKAPYNPAFDYFAGLMWQWYLAGDLICTPIMVCGPPGADKDIEHNQGILDELVEVSTEIDQLFTTAVFYGGNGDEDGIINTSRPFLQGGGVVTRDNGEEISVKVIDGQCTNFPLEVGYIDAARLYIHLMRSRCFARWPYEMPYIFFFELSKEKHREVRGAYDDTGQSVHHSEPPSSISHAEIANMSTENIEPIARAICEQELRSVPGNFTEGELPALLDRFWPVIAAEISGGLRDENGALLSHSTEAGLAAWEAWLDEHPSLRRSIKR